MNPGPATKLPRAEWQLSLWATACEPEPHLLKPEHPEPCSATEKPLQREARTCNETWPLLTATREKPHTATKTQCSQKKFFLISLIKKRKRNEDMLWPLELSWTLRTMCPLGQWARPHHEPHRVPWTLPTEPGFQHGQGL